MRTKKRIGNKSWIIIIVALVIQILFDPLSGILSLSENIQARVGLPNARRRWESQGITHYKFDIHGGMMICIFGGNVEVKNGMVIRTGRSRDAMTNADLDMGFSAMDYPPLCNYKNYTVPGLFDEIERWLKESPSLINEISFDPGYGFVSRFKFGNCGGRGLLNPRVSDCSGGFAIENFQILDE